MNHDDIWKTQSIITVVVVGRQFECLIWKCNRSYLNHDTFKYILFRLLNDRFVCTIPLSSFFVDEQDKNQAHFVVFIATAKW
jgi:hypothetical protein